MTPPDQPSATPPPRGDLPSTSQTARAACTVADAANLLATTPEVVVRLILRGHLGCGAVLPTDPTALAAARVEAARLAMELATVPALVSAVEDGLAVGLLDGGGMRGGGSGAAVRWGDQDLPGAVTPATLTLAIGRREWYLAAPSEQLGSGWLLAEEAPRGADRPFPGADGLRWRMPEQDGRPWLLVARAGDLVPVPAGWADVGRGLWWALVEPGEGHDDIEARAVRARGRALLARLTTYGTEEAP